MKISLCVLMGFVFAIESEARPIRVAVIDTGLAKTAKVRICKDGYINLVPGLDGSRETHGTNVSGLIEANAGNANYCQIIIRWYVHGMSEEVANRNIARGIEAAIKAKADIINISAGGKIPYNEERAIVKRALDKGIKIVASAGNNGDNLDASCNFFPACYDKRITVIGMVHSDGRRHWQSNYGKIVKHYVIGVDRCAEGICLTGTSQSAAIVTGRMVHDISKHNRTPASK